MAGEEEHKKISHFNNTCAVYVWWLLSPFKGWRIFMRIHKTQTYKHGYYIILLYRTRLGHDIIMWFIVEFPGDIIPPGKQCYWKLGYAHIMYVILYLVIDTYVLYIYCTWEETKGNTGENNTYDNMIIYFMYS